MAALSGHVGLGEDVGLLFYPQTSHGRNFSVLFYTGKACIGTCCSPSSFITLLEKRKSFLGREVEAGILILLGSSFAAFSSSPPALVS